MRPATTLAILRAGIAGDPPDAIAHRMHLGKGAVQRVLSNAGYPDPHAMTRYRDRYAAGEHQVWTWADQLATYAASMRVDPTWIDTATADLDTHELRGLLHVAVAMLPPDIDTRQALGWLAGKDAAA